MDKDLMYLLGALEDGAIYKNPSRGEYIYEIDQKDLYWLYKIDEKVKSLGYKASIRESKNLWRLRIYSKELYTTIKNLRAKMPQMLLNLTRSEQVNFLRAFISAEGSVNSVKRKQFSIYSKNIELLKITKQILLDIGIKTGKISNAQKDVGMLCIYGKSEIKKLYQLIGLDNSLKLRKLLMII